MNKIRAINNALLTITELSTVTPISEDILVSLDPESLEVCDDDITYENYINSFNDEEPF